MRIVIIRYKEEMKVLEQNENLKEVIGEKYIYM
jgi:hypothetical protein